MARRAARNPFPGSIHGHGCHRRTERHRSLRAPQNRPPPTGHKYSRSRAFQHRHPHRLGQVWGLSRFESGVPVLLQFGTGQKCHHRQGYAGAKSTRSATLAIGRGGQDTPAIAGGEGMSATLFPLPAWFRRGHLAQGFHPEGFFFELWEIPKDPGFVMFYAARFHPNGINEVVGPKLGLQADRIFSFISRMADWLPGIEGPCWDLKFLPIDPLCKWLGSTINPALSFERRLSNLVEVNPGKPCPKCGGGRGCLVSPFLEPLEIVECVGVSPWEPTPV